MSSLKSTGYWSTKDPSQLANSLVSERLLLVCCGKFGPQPNGSDLGCVLSDHNDGRLGSPGDDTRTRRGTRLA